MFEVDFYEDKHGRQLVKEFLCELRDKAKANKDIRIQYRKFLTHIRILETYGTRIGKPQVKHIDGKIWELRPKPHRIFFFCWRNNKFILLHHFIKETNKTPSREIGQAKKNMKDFLERND